MAFTYIMMAIRGWQIGGCRLESRCMNVAPSRLRKPLIIHHQMASMNDMDKDMDHSFVRANISILPTLDDR
jgi:hypothetical protein